MDECLQSIRMCVGGCGNVGKFNFVCLLNSFWASARPQDLLNNTGRYYDDDDGVNVYYIPFGRVLGDTRKSSRRSSSDWDLEERYSTNIFLDLFVVCGFKVNHSSPGIIYTVL